LPSICKPQQPLILVCCELVKKLDNFIEQGSYHLNIGRVADYGYQLTTKSFSQISF